MIGGIVTDTLIGNHAVWVLCKGILYPGDRCAIYVVRTPDAEAIKDGDSLWWQGDRAFWKAPGAAKETVLARIGFSAVKRPHVDRLNSVGAPAELGTPTHEDHEWAREQLRKQAENAD